MMRKKLGIKRGALLFFCLTVVFLFGACAQKDDISLLQEKDESPTATSAASEVLMAPAPEKGEKIAEIDGCGYLYDRQYVFKLIHLRYPLIPTEDQVNLLVAMEIYALEAQDLGLTFSEEDYDQEMENWQNMGMYLDLSISNSEETLQNDGDDLTAEQVETLTERLETAKSAKNSYETMLNEILRKENISEAEFLEQEKPYIEKYLYAFAYAIKLYDDFYQGEDASTKDYNDYLAFVTEKTEVLKEKYNVKLVY